MNRHFSLYLDILRFTAAMCVLLSHGNSRDIISVDLFPLSLGHNAVIVFFLLSGYVIAYVADTREQTARAFWVSRLARIYSVALPAMLLTPLLDMVGEASNPDFYAGGLTTHDYWWIRLAASLLFVNELWTVSIMPFSNSPYWSLCYEMCYYALFSVYCFETGRRRIVLLLLLCLLIGPKILLLFPLWALGVVLYRYRPWYRIAERSGWTLCLLSLAGAAAYQYLDIYNLLSKDLARIVGPHVYRDLHFSKHFLADYLLAAVIAINFVGFRAIAHRIMPMLGGARSLLQRLSAYTFALYLFHLPLLVFFAALLRGNPNGHAYFLTAVGLCLVTSLLLGGVTEAFKDRLKAWLDLKLPRSVP